MDTKLGKNIILNHLFNRIAGFYLKPYSLIFSKYLMKTEHMISSWSVMSVSSQMISSNFICMWN